MEKKYSDPRHIDKKDFRNESAILWTSELILKVIFQLFCWSMGIWKKMLIEIPQNGQFGTHLKDKSVIERLLNFNRRILTPDKMNYLPTCGICFKELSN